MHVFGRCRRSVLPLSCLAAALGACGSDPAGGILVSVSLEAETPRPTHLEVSWFGPGGVLLGGGRAPRTGQLPAADGVLATIYIEPAGPPGEARSVLVVGMAGERRAAVGARRLTAAPNQRVDLLLRAHLPDTDGDGLPDEIDEDCAARCGPRDAGAEGRAPDVGGAVPDAATSLPDAAPPPDAGPEGAPRPPDAGPDAAPVDLVTGLVAYWSFEDGAGSATAADRSGNGNTATLRAMDPQTAWVPGPPGLGTALRFDGKGWLSTAASPSVDGLREAYTFAAWVNKRVDQPRHRVILHRQRGTTSGDALWFGFADNRPFVQPDDRKLTGPTPLPPGQWSHVAGTYDGTTLRLYVDGALVGTLVANPVLRPEPRGLTIGAEMNDASLEANNGFLEGDLDDLLIYRRALGAAEIAALAAKRHP